MSKRLLFYCWGSLLEPDLCEELKNLGYEPVLFSRRLQNYHADAGFAGELIQVLHEKKIKLVLSYDYFPLISMICEINHIPYVSWIYDCPQYTLLSQTIKNSCNYLYCFDCAYAARLSLLGAGNCFHFPLAGRSSRADTLQQDRVQHEISFVGNLYNEKKNRLRNAELSPYAKGFVEGISEAQLLVYGYNFIKESLPIQLAEEIVTKCKLTLGEGYHQDDVQMAADAIGMEVSAKERERVLTKISRKYRLALYTGSVLPETLQNENIVNCGFADYHRKMPEVFAGSRINLNITSRTIETGIPQRVFDILSAGGFCLTNYQPEIAENFEDGSELVMYTDMDDMMQKIDYYLSHEEERCAVAKRGRQKIKERFELKDRLGEMLIQVKANAQPDR